MTSRQLDRGTIDTSVSTAVVGCLNPLRSSPSSDGPPLADHDLFLGEIRVFFLDRFRQDGITNQPV